MELHVSGPVRGGCLDILQRRYVPKIGIVKLIVIIAITWITPFAGLGNLIFIWANPNYRKNAIVALSITIVSSLVATILIHVAGLSEAVHIVALLIAAGMRVWMTIDAVNAYRRYKIPELW